MESTNKVLKSLLKQVTNILTQTINTAFNVPDEAVVTPIINKPTQDYQCPTAVKLFNKYKKSHNSFGCQTVKALAQELQAKLVPNDLIDTLEINDNGFIYIHVKDAYVEQEINKVLNYGINVQQEAPQTVVVDFSSPNIAKEMHVGHLRSTILGESLCRILEIQGHKVHRVNHVGDWGTQFGMLICYLKETFPDYLQNMPAISDLDLFYKEARKKFDFKKILEKDPDFAEKFKQDRNYKKNYEEDPDFQKKLVDDPEFRKKYEEVTAFKKKSQLATVALQQGDPTCREAWKALCDISRKEFNKIYQRLDIKLEEYGESFYNPMLPGLVKEGEEKGFVKENEGAKCMFIEGNEVPLMLVKSDGGYNYDSTDLAAAKYRLLDLKADRICILTDVGQKPHFDLIFEAAKMFGWHQPPKTRMEHMGFGLILDKDGHKFSTRSGESVKLLDLLDEAKKRAADQLILRLKENKKESKKGPNKEGGQTHLKESEIKESAERIGMAAIKYFDLKQNRMSNYRFDYDQMLDIKGNTAVYLLFAYARICSIITKSGMTQDDMKNALSKGGFKITHPHERYLAMQLLRLPEVLETVTEELNIHKLCDFIYDVAVKVAEGYSKYRIIDDPNKETRVLLCEAIRKVLDTAFYLVGIQPLEKI